MFHVEVRQFPHQGRAFNLSPDQLQEGVLEPWVRGEEVEVQDRRWSPKRAKLTIYEGRALEVQEIGLGRGWANVTRTARDVTGTLLAQARERVRARPDLEELKAQLLARAAREPLSIAEVVEVAGRDGAQPELAREVVWQLLLEGRIALIAPET